VAQVPVCSEINTKHINTDKRQTAVFKDPVRTAL